MSEKPGSVLFCCSRNAIRSPMAEGICKRLIGTTIYIDSAGLHPQSEPDGFMITCMDELGINMRNHHCKSFEQLYDISFDIVIAMSEAAYSRAKELTRMMASTVEYWALDDPSMIEGSYQERLQAYRVVRDRLEAQLQDRFGVFRIE